MNPSILIAEDERIVAKSLARLLTNFNYEIAGMVSSGEDTVKAAQESKPDLVLMDITLEGAIDGIAAADRIRSLLDIPIVYITAHAEEEVLQRAKTTEPFGYLTKPISPEALKSTIETVLYKCRMEKRLKENEARYRAVVEDQTELICRFSPDMQLTFVNGAYCRFWGKKSEELIGRSILEHVSEEDSEGVLENLASLDRESPVAALEFRVNSPGGAIRRLEWTARALFDTHGELVEFQTVGRDITDRKRAEGIALQAARFKAIAELTGGVSHNFNNLLQVILGSADFALSLLEEGDLEAVGTLLNQIVESSRFGGKVVKSLQDFTEGLAESKVARGKILDLSDTVEQAIEFSLPWWKINPEERGKQIVLNKDLSRGCFVAGHEIDLCEVILALIKNAAEAMTEGGEIRIATAVEKDDVVLALQDSGPGISKENLSKVFEPFWTSKGPPFIGMGLAAALGIVRRHGGEISVESEEGQGTVFTVRLPRAKVLSDREPGTMRIEDLGVKLRILAVDDDSLIAHLLEELLTRFGQTVYSALSGEEAIELFKNNEVDLVVCDLIMPNMNGWEVLRQLRTICEDAGRAKPPFIVMTGWTGQELEKENIAACGVDELVPKPVETAKLLEAIRRVAKKRSPF